MYEKTLGLDINTEMITAVQVAGRGKGLHISAFASVGFNENRGLEKSLNDLLADDRLRSDTTISSVGSGCFFYRNMKVPPVGAKKIRKVLPFELEPFLPLPIEQLIVDYLTVSTEDRTEVLVAALEREKLVSRLDTLKKQEADPKIVDVQGVPLALCIIEKGGSVSGILLDIGRIRTTFVLWKDETIHLVRSITFGADDIVGMIAGQLRIDFEEAETLLQDISTTEPEGKRPDARQDPNEESSGVSGVDRAVTKAFDRLSVMVRNAVRSFSTEKRDFRPERVYLNGAGAMVRGAEKILSHGLEIPAECVDLRSRIPIRIDGELAANPWRPGLMNNALALAVRSARKDKGFNFRREEFEVQGSIVRYKNEIISIAAALAVILVLVIANACTDYYLLKKRYEILDTALTEIFTETLPDVKRVVNPVQQLMTRISEERSKKGLLSNSVEGATLMDVLRDLGRLMPESTDFKIDTVVFDPDMIQISGDTDNFNTVDSIKNGLQKSSYWKTVDISSAKLDSSETRVEFKFKLILSKERGRNNFPR